MVDGIKIGLGNELLGTLDKSELHYYKGTLYGLKDQINVGVAVKLKFTFDSRGMYIFGSVPYAINGNNFEPVSIAEIKAFFEWLSDKIKVDIFKGRIMNFEAGATVEVPFKYDFFANNHVGFAGMKECNTQGNCSKLFSDNKFRSVKLYNARRNITLTKVSVEVRQGLKDRGIFDPAKSYVKFEVKYLNPAAAFNLPVFTLDNLLNVETAQLIKKDVLNTYKSVNKTGYTIDDSEGKLKSVDIASIVMKKLAQQLGVDVSSMVKETLKEIPNLTATDRYDRKKIIEASLDKIKTDTNPADIYELLCKKLAT